VPASLDLPGLRVLTCGSCHSRYVLGDFEDGAPYRCARCDRSLTNPSGSFDTLKDASEPVYLYVAPRRDTPAEPTGQLGRYELYEVLGRGGMGVVYRARDPELSRDVALKVLIAAEHAGDTQLDRFLREARAAARLDHPNVVRVIDIQREGEQAFFTMDLVRGPSLADVVEELGPRPIRESVRIVIEVGRALHEAHRHDLLHRDVKPGNVLLTTDGVPRLTDFGLVSATEEVDRRITRTGQVLGTPAYMAPEQATGDADDLTAAVDQYSLGAVLYELLTGRAPFDGSAMEVLFKLVSDEPTPIRQHRPEIPRDLETVLKRAMDQDPSRRYASVQHFVDDLERWRNGEPIHARPASISYRLRLWSWRRRRAIAAGIAGACGALALVVAGQQAMAWNARRLEVERNVAADERWSQVAGHIDSLLADGRVAEADRSFRSFVDEPLHQGTGALARAWRHRADSRFFDGDLDGAVEGYAESFAVAIRPQDQLDALRSLARSFDAQWRFDALDIVVQSLQDRGVDDEQVRAWRVRSSLERKDVAGALALLPPDDPRRPLLAALGRARTLDEVTGERIPDELANSMIDVSPDGRVQLFQLRPRLELLRTMTLTKPLQEDVFLASGEPLVVVSHDQQLPGNALVHRLREGPDGDELVPTVSWEESRLGAALWHDGQILVGVGPYNRQLVLVDPDTGAVRHPAPSVDKSTSDVLSLGRGDLDGDGVEEVVVGSGPWGSYDVRVFDTTWTMRARRKLGVPYDVRVSGGRLYVTDSDQYPSRYQFPEDQPFGDPSAVHVLRLEGDELVEEARMLNPLPHEGRSSSLSGLVVADLDGDGRDDVVVCSDDDTYGSHLIAWRALEDGWSDPVFLGDVRPFTASDVDGDGDEEVLVDVRDGEDEGPWVLGAGDGTVPVREAPEVPLAEVPPLSDVVAARRWTRAEELVRMGLVREGARAIEAVAASTTDPTVVPVAWMRAGRLWEAGGDDVRAAQRYQDASEDRSLREEALDAATLALERSHRFAEALALTEGRDTPSARSVRERLEPLLANSSSWSAAGESLLTQTRLLDPVALQWRGAEQVLRAEVMADDDVILERALTWDGRRLTLQAELDVQRLEWASSLEVRLTGPGGAYLGVYAQAWGGGDVLEHEVGCRTSAFGDPLRQREEVHSPARSTRLSYWVDVVPSLGQMRCRIVDDTGRVYVESQRRLHGSLPDGEWTLEVGPTNHAGIPVPQLARADLVSITVQGSDVELRTQPSTSPEVLRTVRGDVEGVGPGPERGPEALWRIADLADAGQLEPARALLAPIVADPTDEERKACTHLLRSRSAVFAPLMAEVAGKDFVGWFDLAWTGALYAHPRDPTVARALTTQLGGLEQDDAIPDGSLARMRRAVILLARARAWASQGELGAARRDVHAAEQDAEDFLPGLVGGHQVDVGNRLAATHRILAAHEARAGREASALRHAEASLRWAPSRVVGVDALVATGVLDDVVAQIKE